MSKNKKKLRYYWMRLVYTIDFLHGWGERATLSGLRFVWSYAGREFDEALDGAIKAGDIERKRYYR